jgi:hypothetical protein
MALALDAREDSQGILASASCLPQTWDRRSAPRGANVRECSFHRNELLKLAGIAGSKALIAFAGSGLGEARINSVILHDQESEASLVQRGFLALAGAGGKRFALSPEARELGEVCDAMEALMEVLRPREENGRKFLECVELIAVGSCGSFAFTIDNEQFHVVLYGNDEIKFLFSRKSGVPQNYVPRSQDSFICRMGARLARSLVSHCNGGMGSKFEADARKAGISSACGRRIASISGSGPPASMLLYRRGGIERGLSFYGKGGEWLLQIADNSGRKTICWWVCASMGEMVSCCDNKLLGL